MLGRYKIFALFTSCVYTIIILGQSVTKAWEFKFETSATMEFPEITVIGSLDEPEEGFKEIANNTVDVLETNPSITFKCVAGFPIEWIFQRYPYVTDNMRTWDINYVRRLVDLANTTTYQYESKLTFMYRPPLEPRQPTCRSITQKSKNDLSFKTSITAIRRGKFIRMTAISKAETPLNPDHRYGSNPDCNISLIDDKETNKICCDTENTALFTRGCSDFPSCRGFYKRNNCGNQTQVHPNAQSQCKNYDKLIQRGSAGVVVCKVNDMDDTFSATFNYFTSLSNMCSDNSTAAEPKLYVDVDAPPNGDDMMQLCKPSQSFVYVGQTVDFACHGSFYYFSGGFRWLLKIHDKPSQLLKFEEERLTYSKAPSENALIKSARSLETSILIEDSGIYEIMCLAPIWDSYEWTNKSISLAVKEPTNITFEDDEAITTVFYEPGYVQKCSATGDPMPQVYWETLPSDLQLDVRNNTGWASLIFPANVTGFPPSFRVICVANQIILQNKTKTKEYNFIRRTERGVLLWLLFLILIPVGIGVFYKLWTKYKGWKQYDKLNPWEIRDFFRGKQGSNSSNVNMKANAMPYDRKYELSSKKLRMGKIVGQGAFGIVRVGSYKKLRVAFKYVKPFADIIYLKSLLSELKLHIYVGPHENIVGLIGAQTKYLDRRQVYIVTEYCDNGNLLDYLWTNGETMANNIHSHSALETRTGRTPPGYVSYDLLTLSPYYLLKWAKEIAQGMSFLSSKKVIHADLAARNVLLTGDLTAKLGDFGLSHHLVNYYTYTPKYKMPVPVKWLAPECLQDYEFSTASDVWAYGITLWEIFTLGDKPWRDFSDSDLQGINSAIHNGEISHYNTKPQFATQEIYDKILECWNLNPNARPSFDSLISTFAEEMTAVNLAKRNLGYEPDDNELYI